MFKSQRKIESNTNLLVFWVIVICLLFVFWILRFNHSLEPTPCPTHPPGEYPDDLQKFHIQGLLQHRHPGEKDKKLPEILFIHIPRQLHPQMQMGCQDIQVVLKHIKGLLHLVLQETPSITVQGGPQKIRLPVHDKESVFMRNNTSGILSSSL